MAASKMGRPINPKSERSRQPWKTLGVSRATYYWRKHYGDLPKTMLRTALRKDKYRQPERELTINDL